jgi:osmoprotectant transport system permease protein
MKYLFVFLCMAQLAHASEKITVGSKSFTESYILGEIAAESIEASSHRSVIRKLGMGGTGILFESLKSGGIDVYPDYSGTLAEAILKKPGLKSHEAIRAALLPLGLTISKSLGFNNTYALAVTEAFAEKYHLRKMSDLAKIETEIRAAFSYEFMDRQDGYRGMLERYHFNFDPGKMKRMEHSLAYQAISDDAVDLIDVYSTDAKIKKLGLRVLDDDQAYFPVYEAVWVARSSFVQDHPKEWNALLKNEGAITRDKMLAMNTEADLKKIDFDNIAVRFLGSKKTVSTESWLARIKERTREHLWLVSVSLLFSIIVGVPLGLAAARFHLAGQAILLVSALIQTVPSLALLCFLIPLFGVGEKPALVALCLYSLLPVVLNTFTGVRAIDPRHLENARALGLNQIQILFRIVLPLASPTILAGVKTNGVRLSRSSGKVLAERGVRSQNRKSSV